MSSGLFSNKKRLPDPSLTGDANYTAALEKAAPAATDPNLIATLGTAPSSKADAANPMSFTDRSTYAGLASGAADAIGKVVDPSGTSTAASALTTGTKLGSTGFVLAGVPGAAVGGALGLFSGVLGANNRRKQEEAAARAKAAEVGAKMAQDVANMRLRFGSKNESFSAKRNLRF